MVSTYQRFNQAYGLFEVRAKISSATERGLQTSFWLSPAKLTYGAWPASGEVDIAEPFSQYPTLAIASVHYNNSDCVNGDPGQFHTYALEWTPQSMTLSDDGGPAWSTGGTPPHRRRAPSRSISRSPSA